MADDRDDSQKTEEPTHKRLEEARRKGQVVSSREVNNWLVIMAGTVLIGFMLPLSAADIGASLRIFLESPDDLAADPGHLGQAMAGTFASVGIALILPAVLMVIVALGANLIQHGPIISLEPVTPKLSKISLAKGFGRLFSSRSLMEFVKGVLKLTIVGAIATLAVWPEMVALPNVISMDGAELLHFVHGVALKMMIGVTAVLAVIAGFDYLYQRFQHAKSLRMSKQELKDEFKQQEGDPIVKARLRQIRTERAQRRMMAAVPKADVVITNPTHFAVALAYDPVRMNAPKLVAKGADHVAQRIRAVAAESGVPVVENPPLARALFQVDLDREIPAELYRAVAEIIGYVFRLKGRMTGQRR